MVTTAPGRPYKLLRWLTKVGLGIRRGEEFCMRLSHDVVLVSYNG